MEDILKIGLIVKPQGVRGELKVQPLTDDINRFKKLKEVIIDNKVYRVSKATAGGNAAFITLFGINDRDTAELFRGKFMCVTRDNAVELPEDRYFIADIIGCEVVLSDGTVVGKVTDVTQARTDIFTVKTVDDRILRFPFLKDLTVDVDVVNGKITVDTKRFGEVSCYED